MLIKTLKAFEKEMDKLVSNIQTLHKNIIFLREEIKGYEIKQNALKEVVIQQESVMNELKDELKSKFAETEDFKCKLVKEASSFMFNSSRSLVILRLKA